MTTDFLYDVVRHDTTAMEMPGFNNLLQKGLAYNGFSQARRDQMKTKPVERSSYNDQSPTFSWIIDENVRKNLSDDPSISSSEFWFQGYQMQLELSHDPNKDSYSIYLFVLNLGNESCLNISWTAKSNLFKYKSLTTRSIYKGDCYGWGKPEVKRNITLFDVSEATAHKIDIYVEFK